MQYFHGPSLPLPPKFIPANPSRTGISASTGTPFSPPTAFRHVDRPGAGKHEKRRVEQGRCHRCCAWVNVEGVKDVDVKVRFPCYRFFGGDVWDRLRRGSFRCTAVWERIRRGPFGCTADADGEGTEEGVGSKGRKANAGTDRSRRSSGGNMPRRVTKARRSMAKRTSSSPTTTSQPALSQQVYGRDGFFLDASSLKVSVSLFRHLPAALSLPALSISPLYL